MAKDKSQNPPAEETEEQKAAREAAEFAALEAAEAAEAAAAAKAGAPPEPPPPPAPPPVVINPNADIEVTALKTVLTVNLGGRPYHLKKGENLMMNPSHATELAETGWVKKV